MFAETAASPIRPRRGRCPPAQSHSFSRPLQRSCRRLPTRRPPQDHDGTFRTRRALLALSSHESARAAPRPKLLRRAIQVGVPLALIAYKVKTSRDGHEVEEYAEV